MYSLSLSLLSLSLALFVWMRELREKRWVSAGNVWDEIIKIEYFNDLCATRWQKKHAPAEQTNSTNRIQQMFSSDIYAPTSFFSRSFCCCWCCFLLMPFWNYRKHCAKFLCWSKFCANVVCVTCMRVCAVLSNPKYSTNKRKFQVINR